MMGGQPKNISSLTKAGDLHIKKDFYFQSADNGTGGYKLPYDIVTKTGTTETGLVARRDTIYYYSDTLTSLKVNSFNNNGICDIIFTAGASITVTLPSGVKLPSGFSGFEAGKTYEINVLKNLATVTTWD